MNKLFKILMVTTSVAPILFTYWFIEQVNCWNNNLNLIQNIKNNWLCGGIYFLITFLLLGILFLIFFLAKNKLEVIPVEIVNIKPADNEIMSYIIIYLLPLANGVIGDFNIPVLVFIIIFFFFVIASTNSYHFNPLMNIIGFHFYEVEVKGGITYVLLSKKNIRISKSIKKAFHLTEYMILES